MYYKLFTSKFLVLNILLKIKQTCLDFLFLSLISGKVSFYTKVYVDSTVVIGRKDCFQQTV